MTTSVDDFKLMINCKTDSDLEGCGQALHDQHLAKKRLHSKKICRYSAKSRFMDCAGRAQ